MTCIITSIFMIFFIFFYRLLIINDINNDCDNLYKTCAKNIFKRASVKRNIVISVVSNKFIPQIKNFWITSAIPNNLTNIVFIASDYIAYKYCKSLTKLTILSNTIVNQTEEARVNSKSYLAITSSRIEMIYALLLDKYSVLVTDLDIYYYKNPFPYLLEYMEDIVASVDGPGAVNVGFYYIKGNERTLTFYKHLLDNIKLKKMKDVFDQGYIQEELRKYKNEISVKELPLNQFQSGCKFFINECNMFYDELKENNDNIILHFICITTSFKGKIFKQKELLMFNVDFNKYYSSSTNKYIKLFYTNKFENIDYDKAVIKFGFKLAIDTNRIFILPKFNCKNSYQLKKHINRNCSYDELFDIDSLDTFLNKHYRENQFLNHKLVAANIKNSIQDIILDEVNNNISDLINNISKINVAVIQLHIKKFNNIFIITDNIINKGIIIRNKL